MDLYLDNELLVETSHALFQHLSSCPDCAGELERRIEVRRLLKATFTFDDQEEINSENILRKKIEGESYKEQRRRITARVRWAFLAAGLTLVFGFAYWRYNGVSKPVNPTVINRRMANSSEEVVASMDRDAIASHQICALKYPPNWTYDRQRIVRELTPRFDSLIDVVGRTHNSYELIEGHICNYEQRQYAHLIFRGNGHTVSVFIEPHEPFAKPESPRPTEVAHTRYSAYEVSRVETMKDRIYLVSDLPSAENEALAKELLPPTLRFVQKMQKDRS